MLILEVDVSCLADMTFGEPEGDASQRPSHNSGSEFRPRGGERVYVRVLRRCMQERQKAIAHSRATYLQRASSYAPQVY